MQATREVRGALPRTVNGSQSIRDCVGPASLSPWVRRSYEWARGLNLSIDLRDAASHERFAICCRRHGNREGLVFLSLVSEEDIPAHLLGVVWVIFRPSVVFAKDRQPCIFFLLHDWPLQRCNGAILLGCGWWRKAWGRGSRNIFPDA